jgi:thymidine kinase
MAKLYFRYGAMTCGKTTALLQVAYNYEKNGYNIALIKPEIDKKGDDNVVSRLGIERKVNYLIDKNESIIDKISLVNLKCIIVDEAQFLTSNQVKELWLITKLYDIPTIAYGLKTSFQGLLFEGSKTFLELSDDIQELVTICSCGKKAKFNARKLGDEYTLEGKEVAIDGIDAVYEPLCPECYIEKVLKIKKDDIKVKKLVNNMR